MHYEPSTSSLSVGYFFLLLAASIFVTLYLFSVKLFPLTILVNKFTILFRGSDKTYAIYFFFSDCVSKTELATKTTPSALKLQIPNL